MGKTVTGGESLAAALEREHREIDEGIEAFTASPPSNDRDRGPLTRAMRALRRHIYLEEEFLFPPLREAGLVAPVFVMLREHAQLWRPSTHSNATSTAARPTTPRSHSATS